MCHVTPLSDTFCRRRSYKQNLDVNSGLRHVCNMILTLFKVYIDTILRAWIMNLQFHTTAHDLNEMLTTLLPIDDETIISVLEYYSLQKPIHGLNKVIGKYSLTRSPSKTKVMVFNRMSH